MNNLSRYLLVLDTLRVPESKRICIEQGYYYSLLYLMTDWAPQLDSSPICIEVELDSPLYQLWQKDEQWASSGVVFEYPDDIDLDAQLASLKQIITIKSEDRRLWLYRFYSPKTLASLASLQNDAAISFTLGSARRAHLSPALKTYYGKKFIANPTPKNSLSDYAFPTPILEELLS